MSSKGGLALKKSDANRLINVMVDRGDEEKTRKSQERLVGLYDKMNEGRSSSKWETIMPGISLIIVVVILGVLSGLIMSGCCPDSLIGIWIVLFALVLLAVIMLLVIWSAVRSHNEITLAWIDAWKRTEIEEIRQSMRDRDYRIVELMQELKTVLADTDINPDRQQRNRDADQSSYQEQNKS